MKKKIPTFKTDKAAADFVSKADLTQYDLSVLKPVKFEFEKKEARLNMRLPSSMVEALKKKAKARGIPYQRFVREVLEDVLSGRH